MITLLIETPEGSAFNGANQRNCVAELYRLLRGSKISEGRGVITIELIGHKYWAPRVISHLEGGHPFYDLWESKLQQSFLTLLNLSDKIAGKIWSMDLLRYGFNLEYPSQNPIVISITTDWTIHPPAYKSIKAAMIKLLEEYNYSEVQVDFEPGEVFISGEGIEKALELKMLTPAQAAFPNIRPGASLSNGTAKNPGPYETLGTIGVVLEIVKSGTSEVISTVALTNHHVARSCLEGFKRLIEEGGGTEKVWPSPVTGSMCASKLITFSRGPQIFSFT